MDDHLKSLTDKIVCFVLILLDYLLIFKINFSFIQKNRKN